MTDSQVIAFGGDSHCGDWRGVVPQWTQYVLTFKLDSISVGREQSFYILIHLDGEINS